MNNDHLLTIWERNGKAPPIRSFIFELDLFYNSRHNDNLKKRTSKGKTSFNRETKHDQLWPTNAEVIESHL